MSTTKTLLLSLVAFLAADAVVVRPVELCLRCALMEFVLPVVFAKHPLFLHLTNHFSGRIQVFEMTLIETLLKTNNHSIVTTKMTLDYC